MKSAAVLALLLSATFGLAQKQDASSLEQQELNTVLSEAGASPVDFIRALEKHLEKYPSSPRRAELERALTRAAIENKDDRRIILYGERVLARQSDDLQILDRVARALLASGDKPSAERALKYAKRSEELIASLRQNKAPARLGPGQWQEELDRGAARALVLQARATGNLGRIDEAVVLARKSFDAFPTAEGAREIARWLARQGKNEPAVAHLADAFTIADPRNTDADRAKDRVRMGELYRKTRGSETGLGDVVLQAYDRTSALLAERRLRYREIDPNSQLTNLMDFTLTGMKGGNLKLSSLKGKVIVFDFWATWCGPCRAQYPLYEEVKRRFANDSDVVFLAINTDEDRELVEPFVREQHWNKDIYFEDGLGKVLRITSIPATIIVDRQGTIMSRMNGYVPGRFVDMLTQRIREALSAK